MNVARLGNTVRRTRVVKRSSLYQIRKRDLTVTNPFTGEKVASLTDDTPQTVAQKFGQAKEGQKELSKVPLKKRIEACLAFADKLTANANELAAILTSEMGKPISQSLNEVKATTGRVKFFAQNVEQAIAPSVVHQAGNMEEIITREPLGVVANISAWNYPYFVGTNVIIPALLTGNSVLYKPSEYSSLTGLKIVELLHQSGIPKNALISVIGDGKIGAELLKHPINGIFFTGSYKTGAAINEAASKKMIKVQLELGGKDPIYVHNDVDVKGVAEGTADGAFYNAGQSCCAVERIYVHESIYDQYVKDFVDFVKTFKIGNPQDSQTYIGPLARPQQIDVLKAQVKDAVNKGAKLLVGGDVDNPSGSKKNSFFQPTVLVGVNSNMEIMQEESFGPVIGIQKVKSTSEVIKEMNNSAYGLTAGVYSKSESVANEILSQMESGTVYWNCCDRVSPNLPWLGRKHSGIGLTLSKEGITTFTQPKAWHKRKS